MLTSYQQQTQRLLNDESSEFYNLADLTTYINIARGEVATQSETLLLLVPATLPSGSNTLPVSTLTLPSGAGAALSVRSIALVTGSQQSLLEGRNWQWFKNYYLNGVASSLSGAPKVWANLQQGTQGTLYFSPTPSVDYSLSLETNCTPAALAGDSDPEILSYPWTDAVPYYAAYLALLNAQRADDSQKMLQLYERQMGVARGGVTPETLPMNFPAAKSSGQQAAS